MPSRLPVANRAETNRWPAPSGDAARQRLPFWNRNKRAIALADTADIIVENYRPGVLDRLGIGWDVLRLIDPPRLARDMVATTEHE